MTRSRFQSVRIGARFAFLAVLAAGAGVVQAQPPSGPPQPPGARPPQNDLQAFPPAGPGQVRRVVRLPAERDEDNLRVGIIVGRMMMVDCNRQILSSRIEERTAQGWGYTYYVVTVGQANVTTRMACPNNRRTRQFVRGPEEPLVRYNSRLPLVIIAPSDVEVRTRIWRPGPETVAR